jgi:hypothetical protein
MPGWVAKAGIAADILPLARLSDEIVQLVRGRGKAGEAKAVR